jgi:hypothetical protein
MPCLHEHDGNRCVNVDNLVGIMELADFFSVGRTTISNWASRRSLIGMPEPIKTLGMGTLYDLEQVVNWWIGWKPAMGAKAGRPKHTFEEG